MTKQKILFALAVLISSATVLTLNACGGGSSGGSSSSASSSSASSSSMASYSGTPEFVVNTQVSNDWEHASPITLTNGNTLLSWEANSALGTFQGQLYDSNGAKVGPVITITTAGIQAQVTPLSNGGFVAIWDAHGSVAGQVFDATGNKVGNQFAAPYYSTYRDWMSLTGLANGKFVIAWVDIFTATGTAQGYEVNAQIYDSNGVKSGGEFLVNTITAGNQELPNLASLANGGFVATWCDGCNSSSATSAAVYAQVFDNNGTKTGSQLAVSTDTTSVNIYSRATGLKDGGFAIAWLELRNILSLSTASSKAKVQIFTSAGAKSGSEFYVTGPLNTVPVLDSYGNNTNYDANVDISSLTGGNIAVVWQQGSEISYPSHFKQINAQVFSPTGSPVSEVLPVNTPNTLNSYYPLIGKLSNGGFAVSWKEYNGFSGTVNGSTVTPSYVETIKARFYSPS